MQRFRIEVGEILVRGLNIKLVSQERRIRRPVGVMRHAGKMSTKFLEFFAISIRLSKQQKTKKMIFVLRKNHHLSDEMWNKCITITSAHSCNLVTKNY